MVGSVAEKPPKEVKTPAAQAEPDVFAALAELRKGLERVERMLDEQNRDRTMMRYFIDLEAGLSSARYVLKHMANVQPVTNRKLLLKWATEQVTVEGLYLEFGVYSGKTINMIAESHAGAVHGFDSFRGLPEAGGVSLSAGQFDVQGQPPPVAANVELHVGWFDDTLPGFLETHPGPAAFIHIDCDIYSSTRTVLQALQPRLVAGTIIVFDEYLNYPSWEDHEVKAFSEVVETFGIEYSYIGRSESRQVAVRIDRV